MTITPAADRVQTKRSRIVFGGSVVVAAGLLALSLRDVDLRELTRVIQRADPVSLGLAVVSLSLSYLARGIRWRIQIRAAAPIAPLTAFWVTMTSYLTNNLLPLRAGEIVRPLLIRRVARVSVSYALAAMLVEHVIDIAALVVMSFIAAAAHAAIPPVLRSGALVFALLGLVGTAALLLLVLMECRLPALLKWLPLSASLVHRLEEILRRFTLGVRALRSPRDALTYLAVTAVVWSLDVVMGLAVAAALRLALAWPQIALLLVALSLASAAPSTPANIGVWQIVAVALLVPLGVTRATALAYILVFQLVTYGVESCWGLLGLACLTRSSMTTTWRDVRASLSKGM